MLEAWGYIDGWSLTARGDRLSRIYHEADLLVAECLEQAAALRHVVVKDDGTGEEGGQSFVEVGAGDLIRA